MRMRVIAPNAARINTYYRRGSALSDCYLILSRRDETLNNRILVLTNLLKATG